MKANQVYYLHLRYHTDEKTIAPFGGETIAFEYIPDTNTILYAVAYCNFKDNYNKTIGRAKAGGRLNSPRYMRTLSVDPDVTVSEVISKLKAVAIHEGCLKESNK